MEQVSTHTRSPIPAGRIAVMVNGTRAHRSCPRWIMAPVFFTTPGSSVWSRMPATPFSRILSASSASSLVWTQAMILSACATRFSRGITLQSSALTIT
ncbi:MAG: hypothetical protein A4E42_02044 [Methanoregulaceae archaeon PtaU1.Bin222]|nr:MAG: hypothetical protein A4E42_02044 [Methanoregulaceae archaeon PtaU1.Bin222]